MFETIYGNSIALDKIRQDILKKNLAHAYLLSGPAEIGKFTIGLEMSKLLQTQNLEWDEARKVDLLIEKGSHLDTKILRIGQEKSWKIETMRKLIDNLNMSGDSEFRIVLMEDIDLLTLEAANSLLKMLEEPPGKVMFILTTSQPQQILETILSRVRVIEFSLLNEMEMQKSLNSRFRLVDKLKMQRVIKLSQGRIALAIKLLSEEKLLEAYDNIFSEIEDFLKNRSVSSAFSLISQIHTDPLLVNIFIDIATIVLREEMRAKIETEKRQTVLENLEKVMNLRRMNETNANSRLLLEQFIISL